MNEEDSKYDPLVQEHIDEIEAQVKKKPGKPRITHAGSSGLVTSRWNKTANACI